MSARYLLAYPRSRMRFPLSCGRVGGGLLPACLSDGGRCHRRRIADGVGVGVAPCLLRMAAGDVVSSACCVRFVVSLFVYINRVLARISWILSKESERERISTMTNEMVLDGVSVAAGLFASPLMGIGLATGTVPVLTFVLYLAAMGWNAYRAVKCYENR